MIISINWLKKFTDIDMPIDELATLIGARLVEVEEVIDLGAKYKDVLVARVVGCQKLENSDHLNVTKLADGGVAKDVERDENGYVQVVCGAPNVREGLLVAWLPPQSVVPETFNDDEPFVLGARALRGVMSNGMIASARELDLFDEHDGILEIDKEIAPGTRFAQAYELDDQLLDIENKSLTHRPDTFGVIGFAREVAAIQGKPFVTPDWLANLSPDFGDKLGDVQTPSVVIDNPELSDRYQAVVLADAEGKAQSPLQMQTYLARVGIRPISAVVDVTNYLMVLTGQPLHAFDYDKLVSVGGSAEIHVRAGRDKEPLELLDGRTIELTTDDIVIAAGDKAIGLAGAMGGANTEIDDTTKNIIVESATFSLYKLRGTQMRHGIFSEAITRFTKGQAAAQTAPVLANAVRMMAELSGAKRVSNVAESYPVEVHREPIELTVASVNDVLGSQFAAADIVDTLRNVEFNVELRGDTTLVVVAPYWRADIHIAEDVIEEVGRLNGFDSIAPTLPRRDFTAVRPSNFDELRAQVRQILIRGGANEVLTYSFVHGDMLQKAGQKPEESYRITNSISPDLQYYRQTLTPSLLGLVHPNIKAGYDEFALFELNKVHNKVHGLDDENVPGEINMLALTVARKNAAGGAAFYEAKMMLDYLASSLGLEFTYEAAPSEMAYPVTAPFEYRRSALVTEINSGEFVGIVGEYKKSVAKSFKLPEASAGFEIGPESLLKAIERRPNMYHPLSRYPSTERDICFQVAEATSYQSIIAAINDALATTGLETVVTPVDIYQAKGSVTKNVTIRVKLTAHDRTLTGEEVAQVIDAATASVIAATSATVV